MMEGEKSVTDSRRFYPVAEPALVGREREYVLDCIDSTWISSKGKYIEKFEESFAQFCGVDHALTCMNGTVALHLALLALGVGPGDEVIVPTLTFVSSANAIVYCGATPVFVDSESTTWNIDPAGIEAAITERTKAIMVVHLYGHPADMAPILATARQHDLPVVEDAAEAHGAEYRGQRVGSIGDIATFSFFGNKIITTGEGGMITTNRTDLAERVRLLKGQGQDPGRRYWFPIIGYNYRMTNIAAAIGLGQMEQVDWHVDGRRRAAHWYAEDLSGYNVLSLQPELPGCRNAYWMNSVLLGEHVGPIRDEVMQKLQEKGIETRPFFPPIHILPPYRSIATSPGGSVAESIARRGLNVPSSATLTRSDVRFISGVLRDVIERLARPPRRGQREFDHR
jgi:perosamine synthetase